MAINIEQEPNQYSAGYSAIPLRVSSDNTDLEGFKYLTNITYDEFRVTGTDVVSLDGTPRTEITFNTAHNYNVGDKLLFYNPNTPSYTGVYNVLAVTGIFDIVIDLTIGAPIDLTSTSYFYRIISYSMLPDLQGEAKLDLSNTIKDFLTQDFDGTDEIIEAPNTFLDYGLTLGEEFKYVFDFTDNIFLTGSKVGFINPSATSGDVDDSPFKIGDQVQIQQELYEWEYDAVTLDAGSGNINLGNATTDHGYEVGDLVTVTGQITEPSYNGAFTVTEVPDSKNIVLNKTHSTVVPAEPGTTQGIITPTYNTVATITDIYYDVTNGYVVETNLIFEQSTPPIAGSMKFADDRTTQDYVNVKVDDKKAYNSGFTKREYAFTGNDFDEYTVQIRALSSNNLSTILAKGIAREYRIELDSKSWLLNRTIGLGVFKASALITAFDSTGAKISETKINNSSLYEDFYFPIGIDQVINNSNTSLLSGSALSVVRNDIAYYTVSSERQNNPNSNAIQFYINDDCSGYETYHLCWKDAFGSFITYPFKYVQKDMTEFERKTYYQKEGRWDSVDGFGYDAFGRGETTYYNRQRDKMILNSGWVTEEENEIIKDLLGSSVVYVQETDGTMLAATIVNTEQEFGKKDTTNLWRFTFEVRLANNEFRR